jgi:hypothetical protein
MNGSREFERNRNGAYAAAFLKNWKYRLHPRAHAHARHYSPAPDLPMDDPPLTHQWRFMANYAGRFIATSLPRRIGVFRDYLARRFCSPNVER